MKTMNHSRLHIYRPADFGAKAADVITGFVGSWLFVGIHALWFLLWIIFRLEPFPFGLLTLLVSLEAIFLSTFVMMSQNRAAERDHARDDHEAEEVDILFQINQTQLEILKLLRQELCAPNAEDNGEDIAAKSLSTRIPRSPRAASVPVDPSATGAVRAKSSQRRRR